MPALGIKSRVFKKFGAKRRTSQVMAAELLPKEMSGEAALESTGCKELRKDGPRSMIQQAAPDGQTFATAEQVGTWCPAAATETLTGTETILFVEDEEFVREVTGEVLRSAGYRVLTAKDAEAAAGTYDLQRGEVDLLLTDVVLPGESGRILADRLRRTSPELKVLLITGYAEQMGVPEAAIGACLAKPFSVGALLQKVRQVLDCGGLSDLARRSC